MTTSHRPEPDSRWQLKGATLGEKTARKEFGLTQDEIFQAIRDGRLQVRQGSMHGNPWLRLLRHEVEALVRARHGEDGLKDRQARTELAHIDRELRRLKAEIATLEARRAQLAGPRGR
ncbi:MAG: hypothetical protein IT459_24095 [Planctomycetes bacterium]|nr:hypothetical protein [Planctomycetota bacterium]